MKKIFNKSISFITFVVCFSFLCCDEGQWLDLAGELVSKKIDVPAFSKIYITEGIELHLTDAPEQSLELLAGSEIIEDVVLSVVEGELKIDASRVSPYFRSYNPIKIHLKTDDLSRIYSASQYNVYSDSLLNFSNLNIQSGLFSETASGAFYLHLNCNQLVVEDNRASYYQIKGSANQLIVNFYNGDVRFDGADFTAQNVSVFQRSTNDIIVYPIDEIKGTIYSTGNVVLKNTPPIIDVQALYQGQLIYD